jgi:hypothetical protein
LTPYGWGAFASRRLVIAGAAGTTGQVAGAGVHPKSGSRDHRAVDEMRQIRGEVGDEACDLIALGNAPSGILGGASISASSRGIYFNLAVRPPRLDIVDG